jgi:hypothetical protein
LDILTQIKTKREEIGDKNSWLAVSRNMKVELLGYRYAYILQFLIARKIVRVYHGKNGTEYYRQGGYQRKADGSYEKTSDGSYGQCKIYRLTEKYSKLVRRGKVKKVDILISVAAIKRRLKLKTDLTDTNDPAALKLRDNLAKLDPIKKEGLKYKSLVNAMKLEAGLYNVRVKHDGCRRMFGVHTQAGSRHISDNCYFYKGQQLLDNDLQAAHPNLMGALIPAGDEKRRYVAWLEELRSKDTDIYEFFLGKKNVKKTKKARNRMKVIFEQAISGIGRGKDVKIILDYFLKHFPTLWIIFQASGIEGNIKTQMRLQQIESRIMIPAFMESNFEICIQRHDSLMVRDCDREAARQLINKVAMETLGFIIPFGD